MKVGIIGGGAMGCVLGYRLGQKGHEAHIIEAAPQIGGLSTWFDFGDFTWDKYYHVILTSDDHLLTLIEELNLTPHLHWEKTKTGFLWNKKHVSMSNNWEFLTFPVLNVFQKFRLAYGILYNNSVTDPERLKGFTAREWLLKLFGKSVYQAIWEPLLQSKFGVLKNEIPAAIIWSTMRRYASTRSKDGQERMGHLKGGGLKVLFDAITKEILAKKGSVNCSRIVQAIEHAPGSQVTVATNHGPMVFDKVISTLPSALLQKIAPQLEELYPKGPQPKFLGVIRLALMLKESLSPYYITNLIDKGAPYTGIIEVSRLGTLDEFGYHHLVMLPRYDIPDSEWFQKSDQEIKKIFIEELKKTWPDIERRILASYVHREKIVQSLWIDSEPPSERPRRTHDGLIWNVNNALAGYSTLNNNSVVDVANKTMEEWK